MQYSGPPPCHYIIGRRPPAPEHMHIICPLALVTHHLLMPGWSSPPISFPAPTPGFWPDLYEVRGVSPSILYMVNLIFGAVAYLFFYGNNMQCRNNDLSKKYITGMYIPSITFYKLQLHRILISVADPLFWKGRFFGKI